VPLPVSGRRETEVVLLDSDFQGVKKCVILTGMSGAGKSTALKVLEDQGMFAIDNIPPALLSQLMTLLEKHRAAVRNGVAAVVDVRGDTLLDDFPTAVSALKTQIAQVSVLFLDASDKALLSRFETTRRRHPLHDEGTFLDGISRERSRLKPILELSDIILDTSGLSLPQIRKKLLSELCGPSSQDFLIFTSFGFKYGPPADCDFLFDVRFLSNPYYIPELQSLSGKERKVQEHIWNTAEAKGFWEKLVSFLEHVIPLYQGTGKSHLHIGIGCTGGRHRSVAVAERLVSHFQSSGGMCSLRHRDIEREQGW
jgi:UPF0042 nucleotide-binding protein